MDQSNPTFFKVFVSPCQNSLKRDRHALCEDTFHGDGEILVTPFGEILAQEGNATYWCEIDCFPRFKKRRWTILELTKLIG